MDISFSRSKKLSLYTGDRNVRKWRHLFLNPPSSPPIYHIFTKKQKQKFCKDFLIWPFLYARAEILTKFLLVFWFIWWQQRNVLKSNEFYYYTCIPNQFPLNFWSLFLPRMWFWLSFMNGPMCDPYHLSHLSYSHDILFVFVTLYIL